MEKFAEKQVNIAVQVLPSSNVKHPYHIVDEAIRIIAKSGIKYQVTPFETVMEGPYSRLMEIVEKVQAVCYDFGADNVMCYVKIQSSGRGTVTIEDKMEKYT